MEEISEMNNEGTGKWRLLTRRRLPILISIVIVLLIPFPTTIVPEWKIRVVNKERKPLTGEQVRQGWAHYSLQFCCSDTEDRWTDENGYVTFPKRVIWAGLLRRVTFPILASIMTLAHGSTGIRAYVIVWGNKPVSVDYEANKPLPCEIVLAN